MDKKLIEEIQTIFDFQKSNYSPLTSLFEHFESEEEAIKAMRA